MPNDFALAVKFGNAAPDVRAEMHGAHVANIDRRSVLDLEHDVLDVARILDVAASATKYSVVAISNTLPPTSALLILIAWTTSLSGML